MLLTAIALSVPILALAGRTVWHQSRFDGLLFYAGAVMAAGHLIFSQLMLIPVRDPLTAMISLSFGPGPLYLLGAVFGLAFFFTRIRGWPRKIYLLAAIAALSPLILLFIVLPLMFAMA